jgi:hypothetical protein
VKVGCELSATEGKPMTKLATAALLLIFAAATAPHAKGDEAWSANKMLQGCRTAVRPPAQAPPYDIAIELALCTGVTGTLIATGPHLIPTAVRTDSLAIPLSIRS